MMAALELRQSTEDVEDQPTASSVGVALQILAGGLTVTGAHAAEAAEALYPGRYVATCKPRARFWLCLRDRFSRTGAVQRIQR